MSQVIAGLSDLRRLTPTRSFR